MIIVKHGLYLNRSGQRVGIVQDRGAREVWRWVTTLGYYVTANGRATINPGGLCDRDLTADVTPTDAAVAGMDSMLGALR